MRERNDGVMSDKVEMSICGELIHPDTGNETICVSEGPEKVE